MDDQGGSLFGSPIHAGALHIFKEDVYGFGVILLELVTGKLVGEVAKITCKPEYAYGSAGSPPDIPSEYCSHAIDICLET
ncbi:hypothetical protein JHK82_042899 [Glycine max]|nr:hypothetical protein JHK82_042899 [Glycine max]